MYNQPFHRPEKEGWLGGGADSQQPHNQSDRPTWFAWNWGVSLDAGLLICKLGKSQANPDKLVTYPHCTHRSSPTLLVLKPFISCKESNPPAHITHNRPGIDRADGTLYAAIWSHLITWKYCPKGPSLLLVDKVRKRILFLTFKEKSGWHCILCQCILQ